LVPHSEIRLRIFDKDRTKSSILISSTVPNQQHIYTRSHWSQLFRQSRCSHTAHNSTQSSSITHIRASPHFLSNGHKMAAPSATVPFPSVDESTPQAAARNPSIDSSSSSSVHEDGTQTLTRPRLVSRKSSGTIIVPREHPRVELQEGDEVFDEDDARAMSPRRSSQDLEKMSEDARAQLNEYVHIDSGKNCPTENDF